MNKIVLITILFIYSCTPNKPDKIQQIKTHINNNYIPFGKGDIKMEQIESATEYKQTAREGLENFYKYVFELPYGLKDSADYKCNWIIKDGRDKNIPEQFNVWSMHKERFDKLNSLKETDIDFEVIRYKYSFNNEFMNNMKVVVTNYYVFNTADSLLFMVNENKFKEYKRDFVKYPAQPFEIMFFEKKYY